MNKKEKRKIKEKDRGIVDIAVIANHFFKDLLKWINEMNDLVCLYFPVHPL